MLNADHDNVALLQMYWSDDKKNCSNFLSLKKMKILQTPHNNCIQSIAHYNADNYKNKTRTAETEMKSIQKNYQKTNFEILTQK